MAGPYKTPGVYVEEISKFPPSIAQVETAIPAFIGYTQRAALPDGTPLTNIPLRITSMLEFSNYFGGPPIQNNIRVQLRKDRDNTPVKAELVDSNGQSQPPSAFRMNFALQMYFANGGGPCYIVSVGDYTSIISRNAMGTGDSTVNPPVLGGLTAIRKIDEVTLLVFPDADGLNEADYYDLYEDALTQCAALQDRFTIIDVKQAFNRDLANGVATNVDAMRNLLSSDYLSYGAVYHPYLNTTLTYSFDDNSVRFTQPDGGDFNGKTLNEMKAEKKVTNKFLAELTAVINQLPVVMPPSSAIAGIYARVDSTRGVWKAPANTAVTRVLGPVEKITHEDQESLNVHETGKSVNAIRFFIGRGVLVWGARTLDGNSNEWRYVSVRRYFIMVEESVKKATYRFVFEPNDANTWVKIRAMIENFLLSQWSAGALQGSTPEQAFYVKVGLGETMTALDILEGRLIVEIGMAVVRPAEFIILRFSHKLPEA